MSELLLMSDAEKLSYEAFNDISDAYVWPGSRMGSSASSEVSTDDVAEPGFGMEEVVPHEDKTTVSAHSSSGSSSSAVSSMFRKQHTD